MWSTRTSTQARVAANPSWRRRAACVLGLALLPAIGMAQTSTRPGVTVLKTGLHTFFGGHSLQVLVTETGARDASTAVTIELRDAADQRRAYLTGTLQRGRPVRLRVSIPGTGPTAVRAIVVLRPMLTGEASEPVVVEEDIDPLSLSVEPKVICAPNPSVGSGAEGNCDGWRVTHLTAEQADSLPD